MGTKYNKNGKSPKGNDQFFLSNYVYHPIVLKSTVHDSYHCKVYVNSKPFPTKRKDHSYVGNLMENGVPRTPCPIHCRPENHKDWTYC